MNILELLTDLASGTNAIIRSEASKLNLTASQAFHLLLIPFDGIPMSRLAHRLGLDNSTLTRNIQKLEGLGLIIRKDDSYDRRIQRVILSKKGTSVLLSLERNLDETNLAIIDQIDLDTQENLLTVLEKLSWALGCKREGA